MTDPIKKRILYVITKSNFGGAQRYVFELANAMKTNGHEVAVAHGGNGLLVEKLREAGILTHEVKSFERDINFIKELQACAELMHIIREFEPDVVHLNSSKAGGSGAMVSRLAGIPRIIFTAHGFPFFEDRNLFVKSLIWLASYATVLLADKTIAVSKHDMDRARMPFMEKKISLIPTAVPLIDFKSRENARVALFTPEEMNAHAHDLWLVTNAELTHNKNLFAAIDAVASFNQRSPQSIFYTIVGAGELKEKLESHINDREAAAQIRLLGYVDDARNYLKAFDLFMLPSKKEGMPYALLEAGAAGLPAIAARVGGIPEVIEHEKNGLLIDPNDTLAMVRALSRLASSEVLRLEYGTLLREKIERDFSLSSMIAETEAVYQLK